MKIKIEDYRGWEIFFDTDKEDFYCVSTHYDTDKTKVSFAACKKYIDDFVKENQNFKPFWVEPNPISYYDKTGRLKIVGIRKDGRFIAEDVNGKKEQISDYGISPWIEIAPENEPIWKELEEAKKERDAIDQKIKEIKSRFKIKTLKQIKAEINQ